MKSVVFVVFVLECVASMCDRVRRSVRQRELHKKSDSKSPFGPGQSSELLHFRKLIY